MGTGAAHGDGVEAGENVGIGLDVGVDVGAGVGLVVGVGVGGVALLIKRTTSVSLCSITVPYSP